jgi:hypothetical protein
MEIAGDAVLGSQCLLSAPIQFRSIIRCQYGNGHCFDQGDKRGVNVVASAAEAMNSGEIREEHDVNGANDKGKLETISVAGRPEVSRRNRSFLTKMANIALYCAMFLPLLINGPEREAASTRLWRLDSGRRRDRVTDIPAALDVLAARGRARSLG